MVNTNEQSITFHDTPQRAMVNLDCSPEQPVTMYTCGPTVYKDAHIGNMRAYVTADLVRRAVNLAGGEVRQVINITDVGHLASDADTVEDKVAASARETGESAWDIARKYEARFWEDARALGIREPEVIARATEHMEQQIELIKKLEAGGFTYRTPDGIYFDSSKFPAYGDFAKLDKQGLQAGHRVDLGSKRSAQDFALWKLPETVGVREMEWDSPWGIGFPGWHIECSAMAMEHLGGSFDIHTGGIDHIPVHHTNEIAQAQAAGYPFARHWIHNAFLVDGSGNKMSKSSGASARLPDVLDKHGISAATMRYLYLTQHYRNPLEFSADRVAQARASHDRLLDAAIVLRHQAEAQDTPIESPSANAQRLWSEFKTTITTDFNTPGALDTVHGVLKAKKVSPGEKAALLEQMDHVLGLGIENGNPLTLTEVQICLLGRRSQAREARDFTASDTIRDELGKTGLRVIDTPGGEQLLRQIRN